MAAAIRFKREPSEYKKFNMDPAVVFFNTIHQLAMGKIISSAHKVHSWRPREIKNSADVYHFT